VAPTVPPSITPSITPETSFLGGDGLQAPAPAPSPRAGGMGSGAAASDGNTSHDAPKGAPAADSKSNSPSSAAIVANSSAIVAAGANSGNAAFIANAAAALAQAGAGVTTNTSVVNGVGAAGPNGLQAVAVNGANNTALMGGDVLAGDNGLTSLRVQSPQTVAQSRSAQRVGAEADDARMAPAAATSNAAAQVDLVEATQATGLALTAGTVWWALRAGGLLAGLVVTLPAWRHADLLAVLPDPSQDGEDDERWDLAEDDEAARDENALRQMLDISSEREHA
jgi:hypothetical protein